LFAEEPALPPKTTKWPLKAVIACPKVGYGAYVN